ncbi:MAG: iron-sulfur cluster assembly scaffold protein [Terriglobia bacterium]
MYSQKVLDHFHNPRNVGEIASPTASVEATNPACGDVLKLSVAVQGGAIVEARFKAAGCVPAIACASWLTEWLVGKPLSGLATLTADQIELALDGLPLASKHAAVLAVETLRQLIVKA